MTLQDVKKYSQKTVLKGTFVVFLFLFFMLILGATGGGRSTIGSFLVDTLFNLYLIIAAILLFGLSFIFAGKAGEEIIFEKQNIFVVSIKYSALIALAISLYTVSIGVLRKTIDVGGALQAGLSMFLKTLLFVFLIWIWAANKMKSKQR